MQPGQEALVTTMAKCKFELVGSDGGHIVWRFGTVLVVGIIRNVVLMEYETVRSYFLELVTIIIKSGRYGRTQLSTYLHKVTVFQSPNRKPPPPKSS
jgi:hypothetical protein